MNKSFVIVLSLLFVTISYAQIPYRLVSPTEQTVVKDDNDISEFDEKDIIWDISDDSLKLLIEKGEKGDTVAQIFLAKLYYFGERIDEDNEKAFYWFDKASQLGCKDSYIYLGDIYDNGYGVLQDYKKAKYWYEKAASLGNDYSMNIIGFYYANGLGLTKDYVKAKYWYEKASVKGNYVAMCNLGELYEDGLGVIKDYTKAKIWYEKAANLGNSTAMYAVGSLYFNGYGVSKDYKMTKYWCEKSAELNNADAMNTLGVLYNNGYGIMQDYVKAKYWYEKSAELENKNALRNLGELYYYGNGVVIDYEVAYNYFEKAIELNDNDAMCSMGKMYEEGKGVEQSYETAKYWYQKAINNGSLYATLQLYLLEDKFSIKVNEISLENRKEKVKTYSLVDYQNGWIYLTETKNEVKLFKEVSKNGYNGLKVWVKSIPKSNNLSNYRSEYSSYFKSTSTKQKILAQLSSFKSLYIINCTENKLGEKSSIYYTKDGSVIYNDNNEFFNEYDLSEVIPETIGEDILKTICEYYEKYYK